MLQDDVVIPATDFCKESESALPAVLFHVVKRFAKNRWEKKPSAASERASERDSQLMRRPTD